jgi:hypothetical protein
MVDGQDEREAELEVVPRGGGTALDGGGGVYEHPRDGNPERDGGPVPGEREGKVEEGTLESEVGAEVGGEGRGECGAGEEV